jgi:hypothetical protein
VAASFFQQLIRWGEEGKIMNQWDGGPAYGEIAGEREDRLEEIKEAIGSWPDISDDLKTELKKKSEYFLDNVVTGKDARFAAGQIGFQHWIIKDDDLKLLEQLIPAAMSIITFLSVAGAPVAVLVAGIAFSTIGIANKFRTKGIVLDAADFNVLMTLRQAGPSKSSRIAELLSGLHIYGKDVWDENRVIAVLNKLKLLPQNDGTTATIVNESSDGRWSAAGI